MYLSIFLLGFVLLFESATAAKSLFEGKWKLNKDLMIGDSAGILRLSGMSDFKIKIALRLDVTEGYELNGGESSLTFSRNTTYTKYRQVFPFGQTVETDDDVFGRVKATVLYGGNGRRIHTTLVQPDRSTFIGMKHIMEDNDNRIVHIMNYTRGSVKASCVRYLDRDRESEN